MQSMLVLSPKTFLGAALLASQAQAAGKQVTLEGKFGQVVSPKVNPRWLARRSWRRTCASTGLGRERQSDWNGATLTLYGAQRELAELRALQGLRRARGTER